MDSDALVTSLIAHVEELSERQRAVEDILDGIDQREQRTTALAVSVQQRVEQNEDRIRGLARLAQIMAQPQDQAAEVGGPRHAAPKRDRPHLTLIRGGMAAFAPVAVGLRWVARSRVHKLIAMGAALSVGAAATVSAPVMAGLPGTPHPHAIVRLHHHRRRTGPHSLTPPVPPLAVHHASGHHARADDDEQAPEATPTPEPSPTDTGTPTPTPAPSASATGSGMPSPTGPQPGA